MGSDQSVVDEEDEPKVSEDDDRKKGGKNGKNSPTERKGSY